jgi:tetratricopeptide (TPR) repeat protein
MPARRTVAEKRPEIVAGLHKVRRPMSAVGGTVSRLLDILSVQARGYVSSMFITRWLFLFTVAATSVVAAGHESVPITRLDELEAQLTEKPSSLDLGAEYRQLVIETGRYDRSLRLFERLSKDSRGGANRFLNLALAQVDKVPVSGSIRQALLGRDAIDATTRAIAIEPTDVAYLIRGLVNLFYDRAIFHRTDKGVADLEEARRLSAVHPRRPHVARIFAALGDGYWRLNRTDKAREVWREGLAAFPDCESLRVRLNASDNQLPGIVQHALDADVRVDTTSRDMFAELARDGGKALP